MIQWEPDTSPSIHAVSVVEGRVALFAAYLIDEICHLAILQLLKTLPAPTDTEHAHHVELHTVLQCHITNPSVVGHLCCYMLSQTTVCRVLVYPLLRVVAPLYQYRMEAKLYSVMFDIMHACVLSS